MLRLLFKSIVLLGLAACGTSIVTAAGGEPGPRGADPGPRGADPDAGPSGDAQAPAPPEPSYFTIILPETVAARGTTLVGSTFTRMSVDDNGRLALLFLEEQIIDTSRYHVRYVTRDGDASIAYRSWAWRRY